MRGPMPRCMSNIERIGVVWPEAEMTQEEMAPKQGCRELEGNPSGAGSPATPEFLPLLATGPLMLPMSPLSSPPIPSPLTKLSATFPSPQTHPPALSPLLFANDCASFPEKIEARKENNSLHHQLISI